MQCDGHAVVDLPRYILDAPSRVQFLHFHAVFGEIWSCHRLAPHIKNSGSSSNQVIRTESMVISINEKRHVLHSDLSIYTTDKTGA